jgi:hypothetical protein
LLEHDDPQMIGPEDFWLAKDAPKVYIEAAYRTTNRCAVLFWKAHGDDSFTERKSVSFEVRPDGEYRTYEVDLGSEVGYRGAITGLRFDPVETGGRGEQVRIRSIAFRRPEGR